MKGKKIVLIITALIVIACAHATADRRFSVTTAYVTPVSNDIVDPSLSVGVGYKFWGVFNFSMNMYNDIVLGADNIFNIQQIRPLGLFSGGVGMRIPMGGFHLLLDWQKFFAGTAATEGVFAFSDSYAYGINLDLSDVFGIEVSQRTLYNFSDQAIQDSALRIEADNDTVNMLSIGVAFHLF